MSLVRREIRGPRKCRSQERRGGPQCDCSPQRSFFPLPHSGLRTCATRSSFELARSTYSRKPGTDPGHRRFSNVARRKSDREVRRSRNDSEENGKQGVGAWRTRRKRERGGEGGHFEAYARSGPSRSARAEDRSSGLMRPGDHDDFADSANSRSPTTPDATFLPRSPTDYSPLISPPPPLLCSFSFPPPGRAILRRTHLANVSRKIHSGNLRNAPLVIRASQAPLSVIIPNV